MSRFLLVLSMLAAMPAPALAQPAAVGAAAEAKPSNWVSMGRIDAGELWIDTNTIFIDGDLRTVWVRASPPSGQPEFSSMRFDCHGARFQFIERFEQGPSGVATPIPLTPWEPVTADIYAVRVRDAVCNWSG